MARITEMCCTPTKPGTWRATEPALENNVFLTMFRTFFNTDTRTSPTYQFGRLKSIHTIITASLSSKVGSLAFEAHVVRKMMHGETGRIAMKSTSRIHDLRFFQQTFVFSPGVRLHFNISVKISNGFEHRIEKRMIDPNIAEGTRSK